MNKNTSVFSLQEANKTLPLVKKIVADILVVGQRIRGLAERMGESFDSNPEVESSFDELKELIMELETLGCSYRDFNFTVGLVDFPAIINNEHVLLCWRSDEEEIKFYHGVNAGYTGRQPIPQTELN